MRDVVRHGTDTKEVISFRKVIPAGLSDVLRERVKAPGTVEHIYLRFYPGQQLSLQVNPIVVHKGALTENLITYAMTGLPYLAGDDDRLDMDVVISVDTDDYVTVMVTNKDLVNNYTLICDVTIDYFAGKNRVIGGVL